MEVNGRKKGGGLRLASFIPVVSTRIQPTKSVIIVWRFSFLPVDRPGSRIRSFAGNLKVDAAESYLSAPLAAPTFVCICRRSKPIAFLTPRLALPIVLRRVNFQNLAHMGASPKP